MNTLCCASLLYPLVVLLGLCQGAQDGDVPRSFSTEDMLPDWQEAGRFLGLDTSQGVASLVSSSFAAASDKQDDSSQPSNSLFHGFFRLLGFDTSKLNAIAVNAVVFIAKMIGSSLIKNFTGAPTAKSIGDGELPEGSPLNWMLNDIKTQARSLLSRARDDSLPDQLIAALQSSPADTDCIQLLVCRVTPFLHGMQRSLQELLGNAVPDPAGWAALSPLQRMYHYLPSRQQLLDSADRCGQRIPSCRQLFSGFEN